MTTLKKNVVDPTEMHTVDDGPPGTITGHLSIFGNVDLVGDRVQPGAFKRSIASLELAGRKLPLLYDHRSDDTSTVIGVVDVLREDGKGLWFKGRLDLGNPIAADLYRLMQLDPTAVGCSFAYTVVRSQQARDGAHDLFDLKLLDGP